MTTRDETQMWWPTLGILVVVAAAVFFLRYSEGDVSFCRSVLQNLVRGKPAAQRQIEWTQLKALDVDVGAIYSQLPSDQEKRDYRLAFISRFAEGFRQGGGQLSVFGPWRVAEPKDGMIVVAADVPQAKRTLLFQISNASGRKLVGLQWQQ
jgi:hypothetical protein